MNRFVLSFALVLAAVVASTHTAVAQSSGPNAAFAHFKKGVDRLEAGDCQAAIVEFDKSLALEPNAGTHINLGVCHEQLGHLVEARRHYREAERMAEANSDAAIALDAAELARALEQNKLGRLTIRTMQADSAGYEVALDGEPVAPEDLGKYIYVAPGDQRITASANRCEAYETTVPVGKGEEAVVEIPALACTSAASPSKTRRMISYAAVATGAAALAGSVGMGAWANSERNQAFDSGACNRDSLRCSPDGQARMDKAHDRALYANILVGAGVVIAGTGVVLWLTAPKQRHSRESNALVPVVSPDHLGLAVSGRF